ncbi:MAG TPA: hypothetical protein VFT22_16550, partial [Kofleriaceae bacterium]|nr:hypothetical protein [Kofleriaceae bacterium]
YQYLPLLAIAGQPCESFSGCEDCTSHEGCGFCATTGKCETLDVSGATITGCPASKVALWPGSCSGFCEAHGASCAECASQGGCGWCAASNTCMEASQEYSHPQNATCAYADWSFTPGYCPR